MVKYSKIPEQKIELKKIETPSLTCFHYYSQKTQCYPGFAVKGFYAQCLTLTSEADWLCAPVSRRGLEGH